MSRARGLCAFEVAADRVGNGENFMSGNAGESRYTGLRSHEFQGGEKEEGTIQGKWGSALTSAIPAEGVCAWPAGFCAWPAGLQ